MRVRLLFSGIVILCACALTAQPGLSQEKKPMGVKEKPAAMDEMMKKMMEIATPGEPHKFLNDFVGSWETATSVWMEGPSKPPTVTKGTAEVKWALGGRFLVQEAKGEMMGMPFEGMGITGYDNFNKKYVSFWVDNMGTAMYTSEGTSDQSGKVITFYGKMDEPTTGEHDKNVKYVSRIIDKDKHAFEIHDLAIGEPNTKVVEITYTRKTK